MDEHRHLRLLLKPYLDQDGRLIADVLCPHCRYNLHGVSPEGYCPECGTAILQSLAEMQAQVRQRARFIAASYPWVAAGVPTASVLLVVLLVMFAQQLVPLWLLGKLLHVLWWVPSLLTVVGWTMFTASLPGWEMRRGLRAAQLATRLTTLPGFVVMAVSFSVLAEVGPVDPPMIWHALVAGLALAGMITPWLYQRQVVHALRQMMPTARLQALWLSPTTLLAIELVAYLSVV